MGQSQAIGNLLGTLEEMQPRTYEEVEKFALDKSAKTFANVAFHGFGKYRSDAWRWRHTSPWPAGK